MRGKGPPPLLLRVVTEFPKKSSALGQFPNTLQNANVIFFVVSLSLIKT